MWGETQRWMTNEIVAGTLNPGSAKAPQQRASTKIEESNENFSARRRQVTATHNSAVQLEPRFWRRELWDCCYLSSCLEFFQICMPFSCRISYLKWPVQRKFLGVGRGWRVAGLSASLAIINYDGRWGGLKGWGGIVNPPGSFIDYDRMKRWARVTLSLNDELFNHIGGNRLISGDGGVIIKCVN